jgi:hypothetical protein
MPPYGTRVRLQCSGLHTHVALHGFPHCQRHYHNNLHSPALFVLLHVLGTSCQSCFVRFETQQRVTARCNRSGLRETQYELTSKAFLQLRTHAHRNQDTNVQRRSLRNNYCVFRKTLYFYRRVTEVLQEKQERCVFCKLRLSPLVLRVQICGGREFLHDLVHF